METQTPYLEHANLSVIAPEKTIHLITTAIPTWRVRGKGEMDWFGETIEWYHVGDDKSYIAIQSGGSGEADDWKKSWTGVKHIGIAVPDLSALIERLAAQGYHPDHFGPPHPHRKNVYFIDHHNIQFEFTEYLSAINSEKNDYST